MDDERGRAAQAPCRVSRREELGAHRDGAAHAHRQAVPRGAGATGCEKEIRVRLSCLGKQCRERWRNYLRPELNKGDWTVEEDVAIWSRVQQLGTKRAQISLPRHSLHTS